MPFFNAAYTLHLLFIKNKVFFAMTPSYENRARRFGNITNITITQDGGMFLKLVVSQCSMSLTHRLRQVKKPVCFVSSGLTNLSRLCFKMASRTCNRCWNADLGGVEELGDRLPGGRVT
ncbi:hypothetical protein L798_10933 [Zootermopsis nevadensis]|uniref:Uncharacterized protein n=1 Tax=Zootermopsis nevadensis TaxID=136037 RepID=A0A067RTC0_ZOONE|nr:hypothetical protein L798_10933 [Zootermopsis nevadensis]